MRGVEVVLMGVRCPNIASLVVSISSSDDQKGLNERGEGRALTPLRPMVKIIFRKLGVPRNIPNLFFLLGIP